MPGVLYMDATIAPSRSLSRQGFIALISAVTFINACTALVFVAMGAALVPVFMGMDLLAVIVAFHFSYRAAKRLERVLVTAERIEVYVEQEGSRETVWSSPTAFTQVALVDDEDEREPGVRLRLSGRSVRVAGALSPQERKDFCTALETAIWRAKRERI